MTSVNDGYGGRREVEGHGEGDPAYGREYDIQAQGKDRPSELSSFRENADPTDQ